MSTYATVYEVKSGKAIRCYPATVQEFLASGDYTLEAPAGAKAPEAEVRSKRPSAGREAERLAALHNMEQTLSAPTESPIAEPVEAVEEVTEAPTRKAPRRRASAE